MKRRTVINVLAFALISLCVLCAVALAATELPKASDKDTIQKCNSTLLPVIVGGLIALASSLAGSGMVSRLRSRHERKVFIRSKLEELMALAYQCDDWLDQLLLGYLVQGDINATFEKFPVNKMKMLQVQYFPNLQGELDILIAAVKELRKAIVLECENLSKTHQYSDSFRDNYEKNQAIVLKAIQTLAEKARARQI
jgi:hypothetical protein